MVKEENHVKVGLLILLGVSVLGAAIFGIYKLATNTKNEDFLNDGQGKYDNQGDSPHPSVESQTYEGATDINNQALPPPNIDPKSSSSTPATSNVQIIAGKPQSVPSPATSASKPFIDSIDKSNTTPKSAPSGSSLSSSSAKPNNPSSVASSDGYTQVCTLFEEWIKKFDSGAFLATNSIPQADFDPLSSALCLATIQKDTLLPASSAPTPIQSYIRSFLISNETAAIEALFYNYYFPFYKQGILEYKGTGNEDKRLEIIFTSLSLTCPTLFNCEQSHKNSGDFLLADMFFKKPEYKNLFPPYADNSTEFEKFSDQLRRAICFKVLSVTPAIVKAIPTLYNYSEVVKECITKVDTARSEPYLLALEEYVKELKTYFSKCFANQKDADDAYARIQALFSKVQTATPSGLKSSDQIKLPTKIIAVNNSISIACEEADKTFNDALTIFFQCSFSSGARTCKELENECLKPSIINQQLKKVYDDSAQACRGEPTSAMRKNLLDKMVPYSKFYEPTFEKFIEELLLVLNNYANFFITNYETQTPAALAAVDFVKSVPYPPDAHAIVRSTMVVHFEKLLGDVLVPFFQTPADAALLTKISILKAKLDILKSPDSIKNVFKEKEKFPKYLQDTFSFPMSDAEFERRVTNIPLLIKTLKSAGCSLDVDSEWMKNILGKYVNEELYAPLLRDLKLRPAASFATPPHDAWAAMKPKRRPLPDPDAPPPPKPLTQVDIKTKLDAMRQIAVRFNAKPDFMPNNMLAVVRVMCAFRRTNDELTDYFKLAMDELLDQNDPQCISSAQDIHASLKKLVKVVFDSQTSGNYALIRLKSQLTGKTELSVEEVGRLKLYLQSFDGLADRSRYLREWGLKIGETKMTGAFYFTFLHADINVLKNYSALFKDPSAPKPSVSELDKFLT